MRLTKTPLFLLVWLGILVVSPLLVHAASPYAGNQGNSTKPTTAPTAPPVTPVSKPTPIKENVGTAGDKK